MEIKEQNTCHQDNEKKNMLENCDMISPLILLLNPDNSEE